MRDLETWSYGSCICLIIRSHDMPHAGTAALRYRQNMAAILPRVPSGGHHGILHSSWKRVLHYGMSGQVAADVVMSTVLPFLRNVWEHMCGETKGTPTGSCYAVLR